MATIIRKIYVGALILLTVIILSSCSSSRANSGEAVMQWSGSWPRPPLFQGNYFANGGIGEATNFVFEGLVQNVRISNEQHLRLAESIDFYDEYAEVKLVEDAVWHDGEPLTSKDIWAFYMLNNGAEVTQYMKEIELVDEKTLRIYWLQPQANEIVLSFLLGQDKQATIPYHIYRKYVDRAAELLEQASAYTEEEQLLKKGKFGLKIDDDLQNKLDENWQEFLVAGPELPIGTGPFTISRVTSSDMLLEKFPHYYLAEKIKFDKVTIKNPGTEGAAGFALLRSGQIDYFDGTPPQDILESLLAANKDLVHFKMLDPASVGILYNQDRPPFDQKEFRQAITYAIDRSKAREVGNVYGREPRTSITGLVPSDKENWLKPEVIEDMRDYSYNPEKAEEILENLGWSRDGDGVWRDPDGVRPNFVIGVNAAWQNGLMPGQIVAEQLTAFGMPTRLMAVDGTVYFDNVIKDEGLYEMSLDWVDVAWGFMFPWQSIREVYEGNIARMMHMPRYEDDHKDPEKRGKINLRLKSYDRVEFDVREVMQQIPYMDEEEYTEWFSRLAWINNEEAYGINLFQNVTGTWLNQAHLDGLPLESQIEPYDRNIPVPETDEEMREVLKTNFFNSGIQPFIEGQYRPKE
ncbi:peptide/nickel transport system substrate-binding protein [Lederbergia galactosidilyticus]|uniref:ABC transporter substrate-binding protein n=1 Tax=Lederbergia galactosidilytica TaxID=217031 RepID=UPI001AEB5188|nr:ABC transporter substrate-binding protein [Lederbergia galactosidilytica]MBP1916716.1 peptide/nickel transport system substrate-binding protein [Lederbergia galactosidilytica]